MLTEVQSNAVEAIGDFLDRHGDVFRLGGLAGTGKTTVLAEIIRNNDDCMACSFTGRAASVLRSKGVEAETIHRTIYRYDKLSRTFVLKRKRELSGRWFAVDEASMIPADLWDDMTSFGLPIVLVGDHGQLEPVGKDVYLLKTLDFELTGIHRQESGNTIIEFAHHVRSGGQIRRGTKGNVTISDRSAFRAAIGSVDHFLCGFNRTRVETNRLCRKHRGVDPENPVEGDRVIILTNSSEYGVSNGMIVTVLGISNYFMECVDESGEELILPISRQFFDSEKGPDYFEQRQLRDDGLIAADYGYCTSVHKFQGSESKSVAVMDEQCKLWSPERWRYTAITRASENLLYCI